MILKTVFVLFALALVASAAQTSRDALNKRLKDFHGFFASQAKEISDAGTKTKTNIDSLSTELKSFLDDVVKDWMSTDAARIGLEKTVSNQNDEIAKLKKELKDEKAKGQRREETITEIRKEKNDLRVELEKIKKECEAKMVEFHEIFKKLLEQAKDFNEQIDNLLEEKKTLNATIEDLKRKNQELQKKCDEEKTKLKAENTKITKEKGELQKELKNTKEKCDSDLKKLAETIAKLQEECGKRPPMTCKCDEEKKVIEELTDELKKILVQLKELKDEIAKSKKDLEVEKAKKQRCEDSLGKANNKIKKCEIDAAICQGGYEKVDGRYVKYYNEELTWDEASNFCKEHKSQLIMPKDKETQEWTKKYHTPMWIGATDAGQEGDWIWVDGTPVVEKNWSDGEPNNGLGFVEEDCAAANYKTFIWWSFGEWSDRVCDIKNKFACELPRMSWAEKKTYGIQLTIGNYGYGGTDDVLKISWSNGKCWTTTPSEGLWKGKTYSLTVECDRKPSRIRVETHRGGNDPSNISKIVVDKPTIGDAESMRRGTLCTADFGNAWLKTALESSCVYESGWFFASRKQLL